MTAKLNAFKLQPKEQKTTHGQTLKVAQFIKIWSPW